MSDDPSRPYQVAFLQSARKRVQRCAEAATRLGIAKDYAATLRFVVDRLSQAPIEWGEPRRKLRAAALLLCDRVHDRLLVEYAVHEEQRIVFVRDCKPVLGHPLEPFA